MATSIAEVVVNAPLLRSFHYSIPDNLEVELLRGHRVLIPFGPRTITGVCVGFPRESEVPKLKPITSILHPECRFDEHLLELTRWISSYYRVSWGEVLETALPPAIRSGKAKEQKIREVFALKEPEKLLAEAKKLRKKAAAQARILEKLAEKGSPDRAFERGRLLKEANAAAASLNRLRENGWLEEKSRVLRLDPYGTETANLTPREEPDLNADQAAALAALEASLDEGGFKTWLLHGISGSGKTEVYLRALRRVLSRGGRGLVLVPEISLTPQTVLRFKRALPGHRVAVLHSMLTPNERTSQWRNIQEGLADVVIGARSAIFAPIPDLELIVVDEEHESSYKQDSSPRYHARDVAVLRGKLLEANVVLGSATPALESLHNAREGKYGLLRLPRRATTHGLPRTHVVQLDGRFYNPDGSGLISRELDMMVRKELKRGAQSILYLNRRGFTTYLHCLECGCVLNCDECDVSLTLHRGENLLRCHYCDLKQMIPRQCPDCRSGKLRHSGVGTEKVVAEISRRFPDARVLRLDRDTVRNHQLLKEALGAFSRGEYDILVGTQMVAKGHDFPGVNLVGILLADTGLHFPDFRASERTWQLLTQVSGRAGRGEERGLAIIQTFSPGHYAIACAANGEDEEFCRKELEYRKTLGYPPFGRLVKILLSGKQEEAVCEEASRIAELLREAAAPGASKTNKDQGGLFDLKKTGTGAVASRPRILGPAPAPLTRLQGKFRIQILIKSPTSAVNQQLLERVEGKLKPRRGVDLLLDVDPQSML
ncbi:MAG: primosomal protein N' [Planctomycetota bacterium]|jgi:primosomal protein N' (replication factor Y)|nr:primosomal protein N' [Planctomycetota bacterium]